MIDAGFAEAKPGREEEVQRLLDRPIEELTYDGTPLRFTPSGVQGAGREIARRSRN